MTRRKGRRRSRRAEVHGILPRSIYFRLPRNKAVEPGPWQYHTDLIWMKGYNAKPTMEYAPKPVQKIHQTWTGIAPANMKFEKAPKKKAPKKIDTKNLVNYCFVIPAI